MGTWKRLADMPEGRAQGGGAVIDKTLYYIGGRGENISKSNCYAYDAKQDKWREIASLPHDKHTMGCASYNNKIYNLGGYSSDGSGYTNTSFIYNSADNTWSDGPALPIDRLVILGCQVVGNKAYCFPWGNYEQPVLSLNLANNTWATESAMQKINSFGTAAIGDKVYVIGGTLMGTPYPFNQKLYVYDTVKKTWSTLADMPQPRESFACAAVDHLIYCIGGGDENRQNPDTMLIYNTLTNEWSTDTGLPRMSRMPVAGVVNGKILLAGGFYEYASTAASDHLYVYDSGGNENPNPNPCDCGCAKVNINVTGCGRNQLIKDIAGVIQQSDCPCEITNQ